MKLLPIKQSFEYYSPSQQEEFVQKYRESRHKMFEAHEKLVVTKKGTKVKKVKGVQAKINALPDKAKDVLTKLGLDAKDIKRLGK